MAATVDTAAREIHSDGHEIVTEMQLSLLDAGLTENIAHGGPSGASPYKAEMEVITSPEDGSPVLFVHTFASDSTANNTVNLTFNAPTGGSLDLAVVRVRCYFKAMKSGGIGTNTYTTPVT